jgi:hypothetical protein
MKSHQTIFITNFTFSSKRVLRTQNQVHFQQQERGKNKPLKVNDSHSQAFLLLSKAFDISIKNSFVSSRGVLEQINLMEFHLGSFWRNLTSFKSQDAFLD